MDGKGIINIYLAKDNKEDQLRIQGELIETLVSNYNKTISEDTIIFYPVTEEAFEFHNVLKLSHELEIRFHNEYYFTIFDCKCIKKNWAAFYTIRAHNFPFDRDLPAFCLLNPECLIPEKDLSEIVIDNKVYHNELRKLLEEKYFRCPNIVLPDKLEFLNALRLIRLFQVGQILKNKSIIASVVNKHN